MSMQGWCNLIFGCIFYEVFKKYQKTSLYCFDFKSTEAIHANLTLVCMQWNDERIRIQVYKITVIYSVKKYYYDIIKIRLIEPDWRVLCSCKLSSPSKYEGQPIYFLVGQRLAAETFVSAIYNTIHIDTDCYVALNYEHL